MKIRHAAIVMLSAAFLACGGPPSHEVAPQPAGPASPEAPDWEALLAKLKATYAPSEQQRQPQADDHYRLAERYYQAGKFDEATIECEKALRIDPSHAPSKALYHEIQFVMGRAPATPQSFEYDRFMKEAIVRHQQTLIEVDAAFEKAKRAYRRGDYTDAARELLRIQEAAKWLSAGVEMETRRRAAQDLLERTVEAHREKQFDEEKGKSRLIEEEKSRHDLRPAERAEPDLAAEYARRYLEGSSSSRLDIDGMLAKGVRAFDQERYPEARAEFERLEALSTLLPRSPELEARVKAARQLADLAARRNHMRSGIPPTTDSKSVLKQLGPGFALKEGEELVVVERTPRRHETRGSELCARRGQENIPLPLKHTEVKAQVSLFVAAVDVTQQYHNPFDEKIEAVYSFPLPEDAAVREFVLVVGDRRIRGIVREREEAKAIYLEARRQGHVASLLTQERPNLFTQAVANIEPGKSIDVRITYFHALRPTDEGTYEFVFPMVVGPRFNPPGSPSPVTPVALGAAPASGPGTDIRYLRPDEISAHDVALEVSIDAGVPMEELSSPSHAIRAERPAPSRARVTLSPHDRIPNKDFILRWRAMSKEPQAALATFRDAEGGAFALVLHPPRSLEDVPRPPREMIFVLDVSGSMNGQPIAAAKRALGRCLKRLGPDDTFQIVRFANDATQMAPEPIAATEANVRRGLQYLESSASGGGTMMMTGILSALAAPNPEGRHRIVSFMTDGLIGNDPEILGEVGKRLGGARIFSFGVGSAPNRYLLEGLARVGRGVSAYVGLDDSGDAAADALYRRIEHPAMTDLRIDWDRMAVSEVHPDPLPDLFVGKPVVLVGRFKGEGKSTVVVRGRVGGRPSELRVPVDLDDPGTRHRALPFLWARTKLESLRDELSWSPAQEAIRTEMRRVALRHGLLSEFTSFVAVDSQTRPPGPHGTTVPVAVPVPAGVRYETTVGPR